MQYVSAVVVMGVSGSGKTSVGRQLAEALGTSFFDADDLHPAENVARMAAGVPLRDVDRWPWLKRVGRRIRELVLSDGPVVAVCSALRRGYRDVLRESTAAPLLFVHLDGTPELLAERLRGRRGHFMPATLLRTQLDALEELQPDEDGLVVDITSSPEVIVSQLLDEVSPRLACGRLSRQRRQSSHE